MENSDRTTAGRRARHAGYGVLATVLALTAAHLAATLTVPEASPVLAVGSTVIDLTPTPLKELAVRELGTADKPVLVEVVPERTVPAAG